MKHSPILFTVLLLSRFTVYTQTFTRIYESPYLAGVSSGLITSENEYILAGMNYIFEGIDTIIDCDPEDGNPFDTCFNQVWKPDMFVMKTNSAGDSLWSVNIGDNNYDVCEKIIEAHDGNYILAGIHISANDTMEILRSGYIVKINDTGDTIWTFYYSDTSDTGFKSIVQTSDGNYIAAGSFKTVPFGNQYKILILKFDEEGDTIWSKVLNTPESAYGMKIISNGTGFIILSSTTSATGSPSGMAITEIDATGTLLWSKEYINEFLYPFDIKKTFDNKLIITGQQYDDDEDTYDTDVVLFKLSISGDSLDFNIYSDAIDRASGYCIIETSDHNYLISGTTSGINGAEADGYLIKTNTNGDLIWEQVYDLNEMYTDMGIYVEETVDNGFIIMGKTGFGEIFLKKTDAFGDLIYDSEKENNFYVYPNPVEDNLFIENLNLQKSCAIKFYSITGNLIFAHHDLISTREQISTAGLSPGIYFYDIENIEGILSSGKIIKL